MSVTVHKPDAATGDKLAEQITDSILAAAAGPHRAPAVTASNEIITDKRGFAARWKFSVRHIDSLLRQGLPHCAVGRRRVRIVVPEADAWMQERFRVQRRGPAQRIEREGEA